MGVWVRAGAPPCKWGALGGRAVSVYILGSYIIVMPTNSPLEILRCPSQGFLYLNGFLKLKRKSLNGYQSFFVCSRFELRVGDVQHLLNRLDICSQRFFSRVADTRVLKSISSQAPNFPTRTFETNNCARKIVENDKGDVEKNRGLWGDISVRADIFLDLLVISRNYERCGFYVFAIDYKSSAIFAYS